MSMIMEAFIMTFGMLFIFTMAFVILFVIALVIAPIERGLSEYIWSHTNPPKPKAPAPAGSFKDFSKKH